MPEIAAAAVLEYLKKCLRWLNKPLVWSIHKAASQGSVMK